MPPTKTFLAAPLALALLCLSSPARAQGEPANAASSIDLKKRGDAAMDALDYTAALGLYAEAYGSSHDPALLYNMGRAYDALGQFPNAVDKLVQFQREASPELLARVPNLAQRIARIRAEVTTVTLTSNVVGARVLLNNRLVGVTPLASPLAINAGHTKLEVTAEGFLTLHRELELAGGQSMSVEASLTSKTTSGILVVRSPNVGAEVAIDGTRAGSVPAEVIVKAGAHELVVRKDGYEPSRTSAVVPLGQTKAVDIPLQATPPITARWWFWTGVAVVVVAGVVTTYALLTERKADEGTIAPGKVSGPLTVAW